MEKYINKGVERFIELVEEESIYSLHYIGGTHPESIFKLFNNNQLITTTLGTDSYRAFALLESGKLLCFDYGYAPNGFLDISVQFFENGDRFTVQKYQVGTQNIQICNEQGEIKVKEQPIKGSAYHCIIDNKPLKELVSPISVEQMKNRGIITLDSTETSIAFLSYL